MRAWSAALFLVVTACAGRPVPIPDAAVCRFTFSDDGDVRVFVVGHRQDLADAASYDHFDAAFRRHMADIAPCISHARPNLVVFPEDAGLTALLMGHRGSLARGAPESGTGFLQAAIPHLPGIAYYLAKFSGISTTRALLLSASDAVWRAVERTFGGIAKDYGVWVLTSANVGVMRKTGALREVSLLRDPDLPPGHGAYVATSSDVFNSGLLFAPDGSLAGRTDKVFLTDPEEQTLDLSNGSFEQLRALETPFARIGVAISRDAFYPPFMQRLEDDDVDLVVQPEAWSGWTIQSGDEDSWLPDVFTSSGWLHTQKYRTFRTSLAPQLTGNFFELVFDGQVHITRRLTPGDPPLSYVGQNALGGFAAVGPWVLDDDGNGALSTRRERLRKRGTAMLAGAKGGLENSYIDTLVASDIDVKGHAIPFLRDVAHAGSHPVSPSTEGTQRHADVAAIGDRVVMVWQDTRLGTPHIRRATGDTDEEVSVSDHAQRNPAICTGDDGRELIVWQEGASGSERIFAARGAERIQVDPSGSNAQWEPDCAFLDDNSALVVWTDLRGGVPKVRAAVLEDGTAAFKASAAVDASSSSLRRLGGSQAQPAVSRGGHVVWIDYRDRSWDVFHARFDGSGFSTGKRIDGAGSDSERLHGEPDVSARGDHVIVAWTDLHGRRAHPDIAFVTSSDGGDTWSEHEAIPGGMDGVPVGFAGGQGLPRFRPNVAVDGEGFSVVFADLWERKSVIKRASISVDGATTPPVRVDDSGTSPVSLTRPRHVVVDGKAWTVWEDDRQGQYRVYSSQSL